MDRRFWLFAGGCVLALAMYPIADSKFHPVVLGVAITYAVIALGWAVHSWVADLHFRSKQNQ